jgi:hypothetical protein
MAAEDTALQEVQQLREAKAAYRQARDEATFLRAKVDAFEGRAEQPRFRNE